MRVLFVTPYYPPEVGAAQIRIQELATRLAGLGWEVSVLTTFPNYPSGIVPPEWRGKFFTKGSENGITVYRIWSYATPNRGFLKRITSHLSFALFATLAALFVPRHDAMIVESPPLFDGFIGLVAGALRRTPFLFMVSDLWPESAIQMGVLNNRLAVRMAKTLELLTYKRAAAILALTSGIQDGIERDGIAPSKVVLFRNSVDCSFFKPGIPSAGMRQEIGAENAEFVALYAGTFGLAQGLSTVLEAAAMMQGAGNHRVRFVLAGDGAESDLLHAKAAELKLNNVTFLRSIAKARMPELLNSADCVLIPLRDLEIFRGALPTKLFEAMACAKPVVMGIAGEAEVVVKAAEAGLCISPEKPEAIRDAILTLMTDREEARRLGANGREYVMRNFDRNARALDLQEALFAALEQRPTPPRAQISVSSKKAARTPLRGIAEMGQLAPTLEKTNE
jgi:glycosyltransferase involved in cell wall biosynthesis